MDNQPTKLEIWGFKLLIARLKSKSPKGYVIFIQFATTVASICGVYVVAYNTGFPHTTYDHLFGVIDNICILATALLTGAGIMAGTHTTDPNLMPPEVKANAVQDAVDKGTHMPSNPTKNTII